MRNYGKVHTSFWTSETTRGMSDDARMLALYLLTCQHNTIAGVFRLPDGYICDDMQWSSGRVTKGFAELMAKGFVNRCETTKWLWICKHLVWNPPENQNQKKAVAKQTCFIPSECRWRSNFIEVCSKFIDFNLVVIANPSETPSEPLPNPSETLLQPFRNQEQEQEQDIRERESVSRQGAPPTTGSRSKTGTRIPDDFTLTPERIAVATTEKVNPQRTFANFVDYWQSRPGAGGRKSDWDATWRIWCRREAERPAAATNKTKSTMVDGTALINPNYNPAEFENVKWT